MSEPVLCFVDPDDAIAVFTTAPLASQRGDDWDDAPYEHNAGYPYAWDERRGGTPYRLVALRFGLDGYETPRSNFANSPWSVEQVNAGAAAWIVTADGTRIPAGTTMSEFRRLVAAAGGRIEEA